MARFIDPTFEEMKTFLADLFGGEAEEADIAEATYWFAHDYHAGQNSNLYEVFLSSAYQPGPRTRGAEKDSMAEIMYFALANC